MQPHMAFIGEKMSQGMNFHPEWGCLAPAPSLMRTIRVALVATAVGATAGGGVVLSLSGHSVDQISVGERTLVRPVPAASTALTAPQIAQLSPDTLSQREGSEISLDDDEADGAATNALSPSSPIHPAVLATSGEARAPTGKTVVAPSRAHKGSTHFAQRTRRKEPVNSSPPTQHSGAPQTQPNVVDRFFTGITGAIEHVWPFQSLSTNRTSRAHGTDHRTLS
jgi:hypothetical protein